MGVWGTGLYSGDFAMDLRGTISAVMRLPFPDDELLTLIRSNERDVADNPDDSDHTNFWLIVADQFAKRGVDCPEARDKAIAIIDSGADIRTKRTLGLDERSVAARLKILTALKQRLIEAPCRAKPRKTLKKPQPLLYGIGDVFIYPTCKGTARNPYNVNPEWGWVKAWKQDGWGAMVIVERGQYLNYLAWYRILVPRVGWDDEPTLDQILARRIWLNKGAGTLIPTHEKQLKLKKLGTLSIDHARFERAFPARGAPAWAAINDISIADSMNIRDDTAEEEHRARYGLPPMPKIESLHEIMA
jgi:hypothetical protein